MEVKLLNHTPEPERAIAAAARLCYAPISVIELFDNMSLEEIKKVLRVIIDSGHHSALEHASYTFAIDGVSRALTHQLVRHRLASFNQQSQRYVTAENKAFVTPHTVSAIEVAIERFDKAMDDAWSAYRELVAAGIPKEDARYVLPNAAETKIVVTMNVRELYDVFFTLRCCNRAQWEIRELAHKMFELVEPTAPYIFMDAGAPCRRGPCPEHHGMSCGNPFPKAPKR